MAVGVEVVDESGVFFSFDVQAVRALANAVEHVEDPLAFAYGGFDFVADLLEGSAVGAIMAEGSEVDVLWVDGLAYEFASGCDEEIRDEVFEAGFVVEWAEVVVATGVAECSFGFTIDELEGETCDLHLAFPAVGCVFTEVVIFREPGVLAGGVFSAGVEE